MSAQLTPQERRRYSRHLLLPEVGEGGQRKLKAASVLVAGAGGLGSPVALYLAAAGVGRIAIADFDTVDESNLQRQVLYGTQDVGRSKALAAQARLLALDPALEIEAVQTCLDAGNVEALVARHDVVADCTDNFPSRYLLNDACARTRKPDVYGSVHRFEGQVTVLAAKDGPCYRCLHPTPPAPGLIVDCARGGVLGVLPGIIGALQAAEVLKLLLGIGEPLIGRLLLFDALSMATTTLRLARSPGCPACSAQATSLPLAGSARGCAAAPEHPLEITVEELRRRLARGRPLLLDVREPHESAQRSIPGSVSIPLAELERSLDALDRARETVVYCEMGARSARAVAIMRAKGFDDVVGLEGGIAAWGRDAAAVNAPR